MAHDYRRLLAALDERIPALTATQIDDPSHPDVGGFLGADGLANPSSVSAAATYGYAYLLPGSRYQGDQSLVERIERAATWGRRRRTPGGRWDLLITNFDSSPDTAFTVQALAPAIAAAQRAEADGDAGAARIVEALGELVHTAVPGMIEGGFHTPNHRWVLVSALSLAQRLFPQLAEQATPTIDAYLAEGIDINADGEFIERSTTVYNPVCDRALRLAAEALARPDLLDPVRANLDLSYQLMHDDATVITSVSSRQDRGARAVPAGLADSCYWLARHDGDGRLAAIADLLVERGGPTLPWVLEPFLTHPEWRDADPVVRQAPETSFRRFYPAARLWRCRRGRTSATVAEGLATPLHLRHGDAELAALRISSTYFATGGFIGARMAAVDGDAGARLHHAGANAIYPEKDYDGPVYWLPIGDGTKVDAANWTEVRGRRPTFELEPMAIDLEVRETGHDADPAAWEAGARFAVRVTTTGGAGPTTGGAGPTTGGAGPTTGGAGPTTGGAGPTTGGADGVPFQLEWLFEPGGTCQVDGAILEAQAGTTLILTRGQARYRVGADEISLSPGAGAHTTWKMRNSPDAPDHFRLLMTLRTPVDHVVEVATRRVSA